MLRRRRILEDSTGTPILGNYLPAKPVGETYVPRFTTTATVAPSNPTVLTGLAKIPQKIADSVVSVSKSMSLPALNPSLPADPRIVSQMRRLGEASIRTPVPLDRMKMLGTVKLETTANPNKILPNTTGERIAANLGEIAAKVKAQLASKLPNITIADITALLSRMKTPLLVTLGIAAIAAIVYAGYRIYRRFVKRTDTTAVPEKVTADESSSNVNFNVLPVSENILVVYPEDIADIVREFGVKHGLTSNQKAAITSRIRGIAEITDNAAEFVRKVGEIESEIN